MKKTTEKVMKWRKEYYRENRERILELHKTPKYREMNKKGTKKYYEKNKKEILRKAREKYSKLTTKQIQAHRDRCRNYDKKRKQNHEL